jgi:hypothetical protein
MAKQLVIDPPEGWRYGFPKIIPEGVFKNETLFRIWLSDQGYPDVELALTRSRYWEAESENQER